MVTMTSVDSVLGELAWLLDHRSLPDSMADQIGKFRLEFKFLKMFFWCFEKWDDAAKDARLGPLVTNVGDQLRKAGQGLYAAGLTAIRRRQPEKWDIVASNLQQSIEYYKPEIAKICLELVNGSFKCNFSTSHEILDSISTILENLKHLDRSNSVSTGLLIIALENISRFLRDFVEFAATRAFMYEKLDDFWNQVQSSANKAACVSFLLWVRGMRGPIIHSILSDLRQKIESFTPDVIERYLGVLKASKSSRSDTSLIGEVVVSFVDFLLKDPQVSMKGYIVDTLREGLMFLITFLMDPPELSETGGSSIGTEVDAILTDIASFICFFRADPTREQQSRFPHELFQRIDKVKAEIKTLYVQISDTSLFDFPKTNGLGFIDFLLQKVEEVLKCDAGVNVCAKYQIMAMHKELLSLRSFLNPLDAINESKDIPVEIINLAYGAEHAIDTSLIIDAPIWYFMIQLSDVTEQLKLIKRDFEKTKVRSMNTPAQIDEMKSEVGLPKYAPISGVVGFKDDANRIIDQLTRGSNRLEIVSIVGMAGIGKTTLAMKVFDSSPIQLHFGTRLWCPVSQAHNWRKSLLNILSPSPVHGKLTSELNDKQLAEKLRKYLKGTRFLIVLDGIWDFEAWNELRWYKNGSRILLTSRINTVALQGIHFKEPYFLHPLSDEESWKLLKVKIFSDDVIPPELLEVGQQIARNCKGLPLAVVLISRVLARKGNNLQFWQQVAQSPISYIASEGCMDVLEPSYKHLSDVLKSCFLCFAIFQLGTVIKVKKLIQLWIADGIIQENEGKSLEDVGNECLMDLISRNLVIVDNRSFNSQRIKECHLHDLFHRFCMSKSEQEGFLQLLSTSQLSQNCIEYKQYRLCIHSEWRYFVNSKPTGPNVHSLLVHPVDSCKKHHHDQDFFSRFKLLRVLDLEVLQWGVLFPQELTSLVYLRFLAITGDFKSIPPSIYKLLSLETLRVRCYGSVIVLPSTICKMKKLRHVDIPSGATVSWDDYDLDKSMGLHTVVTFSSLYVSRREDAEMLLRMLPKIRGLRFQFYNQFPALDFLDNLESLKVHKVGRAPYSYSFTFPSMIRELTLSNLGLPWDGIFAIAKLPNLETLKLLSRSFTGPCWNLEFDEFLELKFLKLEGLDFEKWNMQGGFLPCLQRLLVKDCANLEEIPECFKENSALGILEVHGCRFSVAARTIAQEQEYSGSDIRVIIAPEDTKELSSSRGTKTDAVLDLSDFESIIGSRHEWKDSKKDGQGE